MRACALVLVMACAPAARPRTDLQARPHADELSGTVVDETGQPLANLTVIACGDAMPCTAVYRDALTSPRPLEEILRDVQPRGPAETVAITKTDARGGWHASVWRPPTSSELVIVTAAPGHEVSLHGGSIGLAEPEVATTVLRRTVPLEIELRCHEPPCADKYVMDVKGPVHISYARNTTHFDRLPPGDYEISVLQGFGAPGEHRGAATITTAAGSANKLAIEMQRVGTGLSISGRAAVHKQGETVRSGLHLTATCRGPDAGGDRAVVRSALTDDVGAFTLDDVGPAPCQVEITTAFDGYKEARASAGAKVTSLPASALRVEAELEADPIVE
jgi:hypothetical protein